MSTTKIQLNTIEEAIEDIRQGKVIIVVDDEDRENEGDFLAAAEKVTPEMINFMATHGRGLICTPLTKAAVRSWIYVPWLATTPITWKLLLRFQ
jgi:3,4-dihydroxy 2-butanone 4-phosphate synthase/GTP cyclohydrolase II